MSPTGGTTPRQTRSRSLSNEYNKAKIRKKNHGDTPSTSLVKTVNHSHNDNLITIPTNNMYNHLSDDVTEQETVDVNNKPAARPPPLCVFNIKINDLVENFKAIIDPNDVNIRMTQHGTKVFVNSPENFTKLKDHFTKTKVNFYTHTLPGSRTTKFVIYGLLSTIEITTIYSSLAFHGLFPVNVKKLSVKKQRYDNQATFLVYFKQTDKVSLAKLQQIKAIDNLIVSFRHYSRNFVGPTQCTKCLHYGHGKQNCNLIPRCIRCAGNHASSACTLVEKANDPVSRIPQDKVKCANCTGQHTANFSRYPARLQYMEMKRSVQQKRPIKIQNPAYTRQPVYTNLQQTHSSHQRSWAQVVTQSTAKSPSSDQLSPEECMQVFDYFTTLYDQGLTVQQQIRAIAEFTFTFMYNRSRHHVSR